MAFDALAHADDPDRYRLLRKIGKSIERGDVAGARALCAELLAIDPANVDALTFLAALALESGDRESAAALAARAHAADPNHARVLLLEGGAHAARGDREAMLRGYCAGLSRAGAGLAELARMPGFGALCTGAMAAVDAARQEAVDAALAPIVARYGRAALEKIEHAVEMHFGRRPIAWPHPLQRPTFLLVPDLPPQPWFERGQFPFFDRIEAATDAIRAEMLAVLETDIGLAPYIDMRADAPAEPIWRALNRSPEWSAFHFFRHGRRFDENCARAPRTAALLEALPLMRIEEHSPEAMFSVLKPRTRIPPHTGVINGRLTVHLPLVVPPDCGMLKCGGEARPWEVGRCMVFDDSMVHEAWNDSDQTRVVLIFDVWNPHLSAAEREGLAAAIVAIGRFNRRYGRGPSSREEQ